MGLRIWGVMTKDHGCMVSGGGSRFGFNPAAEPDVERSQSVNQSVSLSLSFFRSVSLSVSLIGCPSLQPKRALHRAILPQSSTREEPRPHAWSMCAACVCPCISLSRATPLGRLRYQTSKSPLHRPGFLTPSLIRPNYVVKTPPQN